MTYNIEPGRTIVYPPLPHFVLLLIQSPMEVSDEDNVRCFVPLFPFNRFASITPTKRALWRPFLLYKLTEPQCFELQEMNSNQFNERLMSPQLEHRFEK